MPSPRKMTSEDKKIVGRCVRCGAPYNHAWWNGMMNMLTSHITSAGGRGALADDVACPKCWKKMRNKDVYDLRGFTFQDDDLQTSMPFGPVPKKGGWQNFY